MTTIFYSPAYAENIESKIINVQNIYFMYYSGTEYKEIFRIPKDSHIYGYRLLSDNKALFAYQESGHAEAIAILDVIDAKTGKKIFNDRFGGAGETSFDFSKETGKGVYNDFHGLNIIQLIGENVIIYPIKSVKDKNPYAPFWVDSNTVGYFIYKDDEPVFKTIKAPKK